MFEMRRALAILVAVFVSLFHSISLQNLTLKSESVLVFSNTSGVSLDIFPYYAYPYNEVFLAVAQFGNDNSLCYNVSLWDTKGINQGVAEINSSFCLENPIFKTDTLETGNLVINTQQTKSIKPHVTENNVRIYNRTGTLVRTLVKASNTIVQSLITLNNGVHVLIGFQNGSVSFFNGKRSFERAALTLIKKNPISEAGVTALCDLTSDDLVFAIACASDIYVYAIKLNETNKRIDQSKTIGTFAAAHTSYIVNMVKLVSVINNTNIHYLISGSADGTIKKWQITNFFNLGVSTNPNSSKKVLILELTLLSPFGTIVSFNHLNVGKPNRTLLAVGGGATTFNEPGKLQVWDIGSEGDTYYNDQPASVPIAPLVPQDIDFDNGAKVIDVKQLSNYQLAVGTAYVNGTSSVTLYTVSSVPFYTV